MGNRLEFNPSSEFILESLKDNGYEGFYLEEMMYVGDRLLISLTLSIKRKELMDMPMLLKIVKLLLENGEDVYQVIVNSKCDSQHMDTFYVHDYINHKPST